MANADGAPTPLYYVAKELNYEFFTIASQLQSLHSLGAYHLGMLPPGTMSLPNDAEFMIEPSLELMEYRPPQPVDGLLLGYFGEIDSPSYVLVVNLNYKQNITKTLVGAGKLDIFDAKSGKWSVVNSNRVELNLKPGGGILARFTK